MPYEDAVHANQGEMHDRIMNDRPNYRTGRDSGETLADRIVTDWKVTNRSRNDESVHESSG